MRRLRNWAFPVRETAHTLTAREAFDLFDADGNGWLSEVELRAVITRQGGGAPLSDSEFDAIFSDFDLNHDGQIQFAEFSRMWGDCPAPAAAQRPAAAAAAQVAIGLGVRRPPPMASLSSIPPLASKGLAEQKSELAVATRARTNSLRAVLTNVQPESLRAKIDELIEQHLGMRLRHVAGERTEARGAAALARSLAPCTQLYEPTEAEGLAGHYNGTIVLFFYPDLPDEASTNFDTMASKLLELRAADRQKALHHVIAVPCNPSLATDFFAAPRERSIASGLRKRWRTAGTPNAQAMKEHRHLARLLLPLMSGVAAGNASRGGPAGVEIS